MADNDKFELELVNVRLNHDKTLYSDTSISGASEAVEFLKNEMEDYDREHFVILNLNTKAQVINASVISIGDLSMAPVHPREVFKASILSNAASVIMLHNHPSGIAEPSEPDRQLTTRLVTAGKIMGVRVLDHIVVGRDEYYSFASEGLIEDVSKNADVLLRDFLAFEEEAEYSTDKKASFRDKVAEAFIASLEEDPKGWVKKWASNDTGRPFNMASGRRYNGLNAAWLKFVERERGYTDPRWLTFNQVKKMNEGREADDRIVIPKGTKMTPVEYFFMYDNLNKKTIPWNEYNALSPEEKDQRVDTNTGEIVTEGGLFGNSIKQRFDLRSRDHYVFNASQLENMPEFEFEKTVNDIAPSEVVNRIASGMGVSIIEAEQDRAYYVPELDRITLPLRSQFESDYDYQSTALHELGHATGHESRLNRNIRNDFGSPEYAYEELIAEMTSCFMGEYVESPMNDKDLDNHIAYVQNWIEAIKKDKNYLFRAIKEADKAADYMIDKGGLEALRENEIINSFREKTQNLQPERMVKMQKRLDIERLYTLDEIYEEADGKAHLSPELKRKDKALIEFTDWLHNNGYMDERSAFDSNHGIYAFDSWEDAMEHTIKAWNISALFSESGTLLYVREGKERLNSLEKDYIYELSSSQIQNMLNDFANDRPSLPEGLFYERGNTIGGDPVFTAVDNSDGNAWTEDFKTLEGVSDWLSGAAELSEIREREADGHEGLGVYEPENLVPMPGIERLGELKKEHSHTLREFLLENQNSRIELRTPYEVFFLTRGNIDEYLSDEKHNNILEQEIISTRNQKDDWGFESIVVKVGEELSASSDNISIDGHDGTWYVVAVDSRNGEPVFELEHEEYGDEAAHLIVDKDRNIIYDDVWNGFDDMRERDDINAQILENDAILKAREAKVYTFRFIYNDNENKAAIEFIANDYEEAIGLYNAWCMDDEGQEEPYRIEGWEVVDNEYDKREYGERYGSPEEYYEINDISPFEALYNKHPEEMRESISLIGQYLGEEFQLTDQEIIDSFDDLSNIGIAYSTDETEEYEFQATLRLSGKAPVIDYAINNEVWSTVGFNDYDEFNRWFSGMDFSGFISEMQEIVDERISNKEIIRSETGDRFTILNAEIVWQEGSLADGNFIYGQRFSSLKELEETLVSQDIEYNANGKRGYDKTGVRVEYITPDNKVHIYEDRYDVGDGVEFMNVTERVTQFINYYEKPLPFELSERDKEFIEEMASKDGYERYSKTFEYLKETRRVHAESSWDMPDDERFIRNKFELLSEETEWDGSFNEEPIIRLVPQKIDYQGQLDPGLYYMSNPAGVGYWYFEVESRDPWRESNFIDINDRALGEKYLTGKITREEAENISDKMYQNVKDYLENNIIDLPNYLRFRDEMKEHFPGEENNIGKLTTAELIDGIERGKTYSAVNVLSAEERNILHHLINDFREDFALDHKDYDERFSLTKSLLDRISNFYFMKDFDELKENTLSKEEVRYEGLIKSYSEALIDGDYAFIERTQNIIVNSVGLDAFKEIQDKALDLAYQDEGYRKRMADEDRGVTSSEYSSELPEDVNEESAAYQEDSLLYRIKDELKKLNYEFVDYNRLSNYPDDKHLSVVLARNNETGEYTTWGYNSESGGLYHGHYNIPSEREAYVDYYERMQEHLRPPYRVAIYSGEYTGRSLEEISNTDVFEDGYSNRKILAYVDTEEEGRAILGEFVSSSSHNNSSDEFVTIEQVALELLEYDEDGDLLSNELIAYTNKPVEYDRENRSIIIGIDDTGNYVAAFTSEGGYNGIIVPFNGIGYISGFNDFAAREIADKYDAFHELIKEDYMRANDTLIKLYLDNAPDLLDSSLPGSLALTKAEREFVKDFFDAEIRRDMTDESISINLGAALVVAEDRLSKERSGSIGVEAIAKESSIKKPQKDKDSGAEL